MVNRQHTPYSERVEFNSPTVDRQNLVSLPRRPFCRRSSSHYAASTNSHTHRGPIFLPRTVSRLRSPSSKGCHRSPRPSRPRAQGARGHGSLTERGPCLARRDDQAWEYQAEAHACQNVRRVFSGFGVLPGSSIMMAECQTTPAPPAAAPTCVVRLPDHQRPPAGVQRPPLDARHQVCFSSCGRREAQRFVSCLIGR